MATSGADKNKADDFRHTCGLCMEPYRGRTPKLLPCFHTFCLPCLTALAENVTTASNRGKNEEETTDKTLEGEGEKADGSEGTAAVEEKREDGEDTEDGEQEKKEETGDGEQEKEEETEGVGDDDGEKGEKAGVTSSHGDAVFLCPTCRSPVTVPQGGVAALQTNFYLDVDDAEDAPCSGPALCEMCEEEQQQEATHSCRDCQQRMCRSCRRLHDRFMRDHRVEPIAAESRSQPEPRAEGNKLCQFHPGQVFCFHCCKCDVSICLHCKLTSHEGHATEDMATAALRAKEELAGVLAKAYEQLRSVDACISRLERDELDLKRQKQEVMQQVGSRFDVIIAWATRARDEVLETLGAKEQTSMHDICTEKASALAIKEIISGVVARASRRIKLGPELLLMKNELQAALLSDDKFDHYRKLGDRNDSLTFLTCGADPSALDLGMMRVCIGQMMDGGKSGSGEASSLPLRQLATTVSKLEADLKALTEKGRVVSFQAFITEGYRLSSGQTMVFKSVQCNEGGGYNSGNGIFTAPVSGTYVFIARGLDDISGNCCNVVLRVNGSNCGYADNYDSYTVHVVVRLNQGNQVYVVANNKFTCAGSSMFFSGALVSM